MVIAADEIMARSSPYRLLARTNGKQLSARICFGTEGQNLIARENGQYQLLHIGFGYSINQKPKCNDQDKRILESTNLN
jgi:hypothetical protein